MAYLFLTLATLFSQVDATLLDGTKVPGELKALSVDEALFKSGENDRTVPVSQLMELMFSNGEENELDDEDSLAVQLVDRSSFFCKDIIANADLVTIQSGLTGECKIKLNSLASIRFNNGDQKILDDWDKLCIRENKQDLLVIQKNDILDHLDGTITSITSERVHFLLDGTEIKASRKKIFGIVFARKSLTDDNAKCKAYLTGDSILNLKSITKNGNEKTFHAELLVGGEIQIPVQFINRLDFSLGKVQYLSQLEPVEVVYTPFFDVEWEYQRDKNMDGGPIRLRRKKYDKGLCIHSKTYLRYRLNGNYKRFQAVMGIDDSVNRIGHVHVVISGDGEPLIDTDVSGEDSPRDLDLNVEGIRDLEILVDYGSNLDISDHLDLADAKLLK